jgi:hypothetical protein
MQKATCNMKPASTSGNDWTAAGMVFQQPENFFGSRIKKQIV